MNNPRKGEATGFPFRSERMFSIGHEWFYATREGVDQGPFLNRDQAENALTNFINLCLRGKSEMTQQSA